VYRYEQNILGSSIHCFFYIYNGDGGADVRKHTTATFCWRWI